MLQVNDMDSVAVEATLWKIVSSNPFETEQSSDVADRQLIFSLPTLQVWNQISYEHLLPKKIDRLFCVMSEMRSDSDSDPRNCPARILMTRSMFKASVVV